MSRVVHFELQASNPESIIQFYSTLLGWKFQKWGALEYWLIETGSADAPGINGGLLPRNGSAPTIGQPVNSFYCTVEVADLDATVQRGVELGAQIALPKMPIPGVGWLVYLIDPDGNLFGITQPDEKAA